MYGIGPSYWIIFRTTRWFEAGPPDSQGWWSDGQLPPNVNFEPWSVLGRQRRNCQYAVQVDSRMLGHMLCWLPAWFVYDCGQSTQWTDTQRSGWECIFYNLLIMPVFSKESHCFKRNNRLSSRRLKQTMVPLGGYPSQLKIAPLLIHSILA